MAANNRSCGKSGAGQAVARELDQLKKKVKELALRLEREAKARELAARLGAEAKKGSRAADQRGQDPSRTGKENGFGVEVGNYRREQTEANSRRSAGQNSGTEDGAQSQKR